MKWILLLTFLGSQTWALDFSVIGACSKTPLAHTSVQVAKDTTLGDVTVSTLSSLGITFTGDRSGLSSIAGTPRGDDALDIISDTQMRAYGWCVEVDGAQPAVMPDQVAVMPSTKSITWFYASSLYDRGVWKDYCTPAWKVPPKASKDCGR